MNTKLFVLVFLLLPSIVLSQQDLILFYTGDHAAPEYPTEIFTSAPFESVEIHLGLYNPSVTAISGWEAEVLVEGPAIAPAWNIPFCGFIPECGMPPFQVGIYPDSEVFGPGTLYHLATFTAFIMNPTDVVRFFIGPVPGSISFPDSPGYVGPGQDYPLVPLTTIAGNEPVAVFTINGDTVPSEPASWSDIKSLFN